MIRRVQKGNICIEYELRQTARKSVECKVNENAVVVYAPVQLPVREIDAFVLRQSEWIVQAMEKTKLAASRRQAKTERDMQNGTLIPLEGKNYALRILPGARPDIQLAGDEIRVCGFGGDSARIKEALRQFLINYSMPRFSERVKHYSALIGKKPGRITIREQKTKWGSCSSLGNLNFNWKLIMAPPGALDYVVVHELCHMIEMNHSSAFWALVKQHMSEYEMWRDYLKNGIRSPFE